MPNPLNSPEEYQAFVYRVSTDYPVVTRSTLTYIPTGTHFARVQGVLFFAQSVTLCVQEFLNFNLQVIEGYGYEVSRIQSGLTEQQFPHHKHVHPDIKHNRLILSTTVFLPLNCLLLDRIYLS